MSVAFRRESDEEHKEPKFEIPLPPGPNLVTARGLALIDQRLAEREAELRGAADDAAREDIQRYLRYWKTRRATAQLMPGASDDDVAFGTRVRFTLNGTERIIEIVGDDEAEPAEGRIAFSAPLARAMMGAEVGETCDFGGKAGAIEVIDIAAIG